MPMKRMGTWLRGQNGSDPKLDVDDGRDGIAKAQSPSPESSDLPPADGSTGHGNGDVNGVGTQEGQHAGGIASSAYAQKRRGLLRLSRALSDLGANELIPEVPRIVVIGAQSTGKSSLVEGVTGINVPRDSGTCTRCPMECTVFVSESTWSCIVSLRMVHDARQSERATEIATPLESVGPIFFDTVTHMPPDPVEPSTVPGTPLIIPFSPPIVSADEVEIWIRRAQAAVLCPHLPRETFLTKGREDLKALTDHSRDPNVLLFTRSVVVIDIYDPRGADLSFVDLPGLIENHEDESLIPLVEQMVRSYIKPDSTLILVTVPAAEDLENPKALKLARQADPDKRRTIGVVTKPDGLTPGDTGKRKMWRDIFDGEVSKYQLQKGYYCVRLPSDEERRHASRTKTEQIERAFFDGTAPWKDLKSNHRLGIPNLVHDLSGLLMEIIERALPRMREAAAERLSQCRQELASIPSNLGADAIAEVIEIISSFCGKMKDVVYGQGEDKSFVHECRRQFGMFERSIRSTAPDFRPTLSVDLSQGPIELDPADDVDKLGIDPHAEYTAYPQKPLSLSDVERVIQESTGWELPYNIPYEAKVRLIRGFMKDWPEAGMQCHNNVADALHREVQVTAKDHFGRFPPLQRLIDSVLRTVLDECVEGSRIIVVNALDGENTLYGTQNRQYLQRMRDRWLARYQSHMSAGRSLYSGPLSARDKQERENAAVAALRSLGLQDVTVHELYRRWGLPLERFEDEVTVMAEVRSYFDVTHKRVSDSIPQAVKLNLLIRFVDVLQARLIGALTLSSADSAQRMRDLLAEDPEITRARAKLQDSVMRLERIKREVDAFGV